MAREVYNTCLRGALKGKTRVLVTNQLQFVSGANSVVYMQDGKIQERGTYEELMKSDQGFAQLMSSAEVTPTPPETWTQFLHRVTTNNASFFPGELNKKVLNF